MFEVAFGIILVPVIILGACLALWVAFGLLSWAFMFSPTIAIAGIMLANDLPATNHTLFASILIITTAINGAGAFYAATPPVRDQEYAQKRPFITP
jgi:hypothetical protein